MTPEDFVITAFAGIMALAIPALVILQYKVAIALRPDHENVYEYFCNTYVTPNGSILDGFYFAVPIANLFFSDFFPAMTSDATLVFYAFLPSAFLVYIYTYCWCVVRLRKLSGLENVPYKRLEILDHFGRALFGTLLTILFLSLIKIYLIARFSWGWF
ncbi:MAG: hypothetical protein KA155_03445 [Alphaproteobacteria bacterium]|jgi:hypothetical protein|nr:hypothetical protein [Alphaproteobacteria bacterium]